MDGALGPRQNDEQQGQILGRQIRWRASGLEWEADTKIAKSLVDENKIDLSKPVETPGVKTEEATSGELMGPVDAAKYRRNAAKINDLALDRADLAYASKELSRSMSNTIQGRRGKNEASDPIPP